MHVMSTRKGKQKKAVLQRAGFTMVELMVVLMVIAILTGIVVGLSVYTGDRAHEAKARAEMQRLAMALETQRGDSQPEAIQFMIAHVWRDPVTKETTVNFVRWPRRIDE